jgi:hypothetical protein
MLKNIVLSVGVLIGTFSSPIFAANEIYLTQSTSGVEFNFKKDESRVFTNAFPWLLKANCEISCDDSVHNSMQITILKKNGSLNNIPLVIGDSMCLDVHNNDTFNLIASSGAKVELKNNGEGPIKATCYISD